MWTAQDKQQWKS